MKNVAYDEDNNFLQTLAGVGLVAGAGYGLHQYVYNNDGFKSVMKRAGEFVAPTEKLVGHAGLDQMDEVRTHIDKASKIQRKHSAALVSERHLKDWAKMEDVTTERTFFNQANRNNLDPTVQKAIESHQKRFQIKKPSDITDIYGNAIGDQFKKAIEDLGFEVGDKVEFNGTTGIYKVRNPDGTAAEVKIRFGKYDEKSASWLASTGKADFVAKRSVMLGDEGGRLAGVMVDPNTAQLLALRDQERLGYAASKNKDYIKAHSKKRLSDGNKDKIDIVEEIKAPRKIRDAKTLQLAIDQIQEEQEMVSANAENEIKRMNASMPTDGFSRKKLAEDARWAGIDSDRVASAPGSVNANAARTNGKALEDLFSFGQDVREDPTRLRTGGIDPKTGQFITMSLDDSANLMIQNGRHGEAQRAIDAKTQLGNTGSGGKVSAVAFDVYPDMAATPQAERMKSMKNPRFFGSIVGNNNTGYIQKDIGDLAFEGLDHLSEDAVRKLRTRMLMVRPESFSVGDIASYRDVVRAQELERGSVNFFGVLTPWLSDSMSVEATVSSEMMASQEVQATVKNVLTGEKAQELSQIRTFIFDESSGKLQKRAGIVADLFTDEFAEEFLSNRKNVIRLKEGTVLGLIDQQNQVMTPGDLASSTDLDGQFLKTKAEQIITYDDYVLMRARNEREFIKDSVTGQLVAREDGRGMKFFSRLHSQTTKLALQESKGRGAVTSHKTEGALRTGSMSAEQLINDMLSMSGSRAESEVHYSSSLFKKTFAKVSGDTIVQQKNAAETIPTLLNLMSGQVAMSMGTGDDLVVSGDAYKRVLGHLTVTGDDGRKIQQGEAGFDEIVGKYRNSRKGGDLNLTHMMEGGDLAWNPKTSHADFRSGATKSQLEDLVSLFGQMRHNAVEGNPGQIIRSLDVSQGGLNFDQILGRQIDLATDWKKASTNLNINASSVDDLYVKMKDSIEDGTINQKALKEMTFAHFGGLNPNEIMAIAQGPGMNTIRIPVSTMGLFQNKPEILGELIKGSESDSQMIMEQLSLMTSSMGSDPKDFKNQIASYQEKFGAKVKILEADDIPKVFGENILAPDYISNLKDAGTELFDESMFSKKANPHGYVLRARTGQLTFMPGADFWGGATYLGAEDRLTMRDFGMDALRFTREAGMNKNGVSEEALNKFRASFLVETTSSKGGPLLDASIKKRGGFYSKNIFDLEFIHNTGLNAVMEKSGTKELQEIIGNSLTISRRDYYGMIKQEIEDAMDVAKGNMNMTTAGALAEKHGDNFFSDWSHQFKGLENMDRKRAGKRIAEVAQRITMIQTGRAKRMRDAIIGLDNPHSHLRSEGIVANIESQSLSGLAIRWPAISRSSAGVGFIFPDISTKKGSWGLDDGLMGRKQVALGKIMAINKNADQDGDNIAVSALFSKESRERTSTIIRQQQVETARMTEMMKRKRMWGDLRAAVEPHVEESTSILGTMMNDGADHANHIVESMFKRYPKSTAMSMYITKSMTGAFNTQARSTKGWLAEQASGKKLSNQEYETVMNYVETFPSLMTEQQIISAKHLETFLNKDGEAFESISNVTEMFRKTNAAEIEDIIRRSNGEMHPVVKAMVYENRGAAEMTPLLTKMSNLEDIQNETRSFWNPSANVNREAEFRQAMSLKYSKDEEINRAWSAYKDLAEKKYAAGETFLFEQEAFKKMGWSGKTQLGLMTEALTASRSETSAIANDSLFAFLIKNGGKIKEGKFSEVIDDAAPWLRRAQIGQALEMNVSSGAQKTTSSIRRILGQKQAGEAMAWLMEHPARRGALIGGGLMVGLAALNVISGDGTPQDPNDLPSVNNPSFSNRKTDHVAGRRALDSAPNHNASVDLLTDSSVHYDTAMGHIDSLVSSRGYNSVSVRQDGVDPYRADMFRYTN